MSSERLVTKLVHEGPFSILTIDRPEKLNALNRQVIAEIASAAEEVWNQPGVHALIVTGAGEKSFVAGADIAEMRDMRLEETRPSTPSRTCPSP
jgi:enoyl-CoA hydratase